MKITLVIVSLSCEIKKYLENFKIGSDLKSLHIFISKLIFNGYTQTGKLIYYHLNERFP